MRYKWVIVLFALLILWPITQLCSYQLFLKNGKVVEGTVVNENENEIVLKDTSGISLVFKKAIIDTEKTRIANTPAPAPSAVPVTEPPRTISTPKKPAHVVTREELEKLREKYDLGQGMYKQGTDQPAQQIKTQPSASEQTAAKTEEQWKAEAQMLLDNIKEAEAGYLELQEYCKDLQGASASGMVLVENPRTFYPLDLAKETKATCDKAEEAKSQFHSARQQYRDFLEYARQQGVPPGYVRTNDDYEIKLEREVPED